MRDIGGGGGWRRGLRRVRALAMILGVTCCAAAALVAERAAADAPAVSPRERALRRAEIGTEAPRIVSGARPAEGIDTLRLEELWRFGRREGDPQLGVIGPVIADAAGRLYLLDRRLERILVLSSEGEWLRTLGGEGEGPGPLARARDLCFLPDSTLGVALASPGRIVRMTRDGELAGEIVPQAEVQIEGARQTLFTVRSAAGHIVVSMESMLTRGGNLVRSRLLGAIDTTGDLTTRYLTSSATDELVTLVWDEAADYFVHQGGHALGPDGRVYAAPERDRYEIRVYHPSGILERIIERDETPRPRGAQEQARIAGTQQMVLGGRPVENRVSDHDPCILQLRVDEEERIWVLGSRGAYDQPAGVLQTYDVFDREGRFTRQVALVCPSEPGDRLFWPGGDRVVLVRGLRAGSAGTDSCEVICLRLRR